jgi:type 1 glutamine amidotransferase
LIVKEKLMNLKRWSVCVAAAVTSIGTGFAVVGGCAAAEPSLPDAVVQKIKEALPEKATAQPAKPRKLLLFSRCEGFRHTDGILGGNLAFKLMGEKTGAFSCEESTEMDVFDPEKLAQFDAIVFNNSTALKFENPKHREALMAFVKGGKGIVGVHSATDNFYNWPEAATMMGALFAGHPWGRCAVRLDDPQHPLLRVFAGRGFYINEEMYKMREPYSRETLRVLLSMDLSHMSADDAKNGREDRDNPIAWIQEVGQGRVFYCSLGHGAHVFQNPTLLAFYLDGIQYALGDLRADAAPSAKLSPQPTPALAPEQVK